MSLICETCYIWTALSPDIKHTVGAGGDWWDTPHPKRTCWRDAVALQFILEPRQAPILTAGSETGTKQGITFIFTAEKARSHSWPEASPTKPFSGNHLFCLS